MAGGTLLHDPSDEQRGLDTAATGGIFAPNGGVITGRGDGDLARFCGDTADSEDVHEGAGAGIRGGP